MFSLVVSKIRVTKLRLTLRWRKLECRYLSSVANRREEHLGVLLDCVGGMFLNKDPSFSGIGWHTQPLPGYGFKNGQKTSEICWEAPVCITVYIDNKPALGMAVEFRGPVICIRQLQGAPGVQLPDGLKKWPALFVDGVKTFLLNAPEISRLRLYAADTRISYKQPLPRLSSEDLAKHQQKLRRRYDGTARQCGLKKAGRGKYWIWDISMRKT